MISASLILTQTAESGPALPRTHERAQNLGIEDRQCAAGPVLSLGRNTAFPSRGTRDNQLLCKITEAPQRLQAGGLPLKHALHSLKQTHATDIAV